MRVMKIEFLNQFVAQVSLTFVLVALALDAEDCGYRDQHDDGGGGQGHQEPGLAVEGQTAAGIEAAVLQKALGRSRYLRNIEKNKHKIVNGNIKGHQLNTFRACELLYSSVLAVSSPYNS